jgi:hypothetical protein
MSTALKLQCLDVGDWWCLVFGGWWSLTHNPVRTCRHLRLQAVLDVDSDKEVEASEKLLIRDAFNEHVFVVPSFYIFALLISPYIYIFALLISPYIHLIMVHASAAPHGGLPA